MRHIGYYINSQDFAFCISYKNYSFIGFFNISLYDFALPWAKSECRAALPHKKREINTNDDSISSFRNIGKNFEITFQNDGYIERIFGHFDSFADKGPLLFDLTLAHHPSERNAGINPAKQIEVRLINCVTAYGRLEFDDTEYLFAPATSFASLTNTVIPKCRRLPQIWGAATGLINGKHINLYLNNDLSMDNKQVFVSYSWAGITGSISHVANHLDIIADTAQSQQARHFVTSNKSVALNFSPIVADTTRRILFNNKKGRTLVYGVFSGNIETDSGSTLYIKDLTGFIEMFG